MKNLTIIRHAKSCWENPEVDDIARPLNTRGNNAITTIGSFLQTNKYLPDFVLSSPAVRAINTAKGIAAQLQYEPKKIQVEPLIYFGTSADILKLIFSISDKYQDVFLFGHEPKLSALIAHFTKKQLDKFPTCSVCRITFNSQKWENIKTGNCTLLITPKELVS